MLDDTPTDSRAALCSRLIAIRAELIERMARESIDASTLALLAGSNATIDACEAAEVPADVIEAGAPSWPIMARR